MQAHEGMKLKGRNLFGFLSFFLLKITVIAETSGHIHLFDKEKGMIR